MLNSDILRPEYLENGEGYEFLVFLSNCNQCLKWQSERFEKNCSPLRYFDIVRFYFSSSAFSVFVNDGFDTCKKSKEWNEQIKWC